MTDTPRHNWDTSTRPKDPSNWKQLKALVAERDGNRCQDSMRDGTPCQARGTECDHIINLARGGSNDLENLQMLCEWHHKRKTQQESRDGRTYLTQTRPREAHPGFN